MAFLDRVPKVTFHTRVRDPSVPGPNPFRWQDLTSDEIFQGKKVVLFALPGAFTPTCSSNHLPRHEELHPDGNGAFTRKMGLMVDKSHLGFGMRSWRYSMLVNDGRIEAMFSEDDFGDNCPVDPFAVSDADTMLAHLKGRQPGGVCQPVRAFEG